MRIHVDCNSLARGFLMEQICIVSYVPFYYYLNIYRNLIILTGFSIDKLRILTQTNFLHDRL